MKIHFKIRFSIIFCDVTTKVFPPFDPFQKYFTNSINFLAISFNSTFSNNWIKAACSAHTYTNEVWRKNTPKYTASLHHELRSVFAHLFSFYFWTLFPSRRCFDIAFVPAMRHFVKWTASSAYRWSSSHSMAMSTWLE